MTEPIRPFGRHRVTVLTPVPTAPLTFGNRKRVWSLCSGLKARGLEVTLILYAIDDEWRQGIARRSLEQMRLDWDVHVVPASGPVHAAASGADHSIDEWWDPALERFLHWYFSGARPDAFIVNYPFLSRALELAPPTCLKVLDTHDRFGDRRQMLGSLGIKPEFFHTTAEQEAVALSRAELCLAITETEQRYFEALTDRPVVALPHAEPTRPRLRSPPADGYLRLGLIGAANNVNRVNIARFLNEALPRFIDHMAPVKVVVAGTVCAGLSRFRGARGVEFMGPVDEVQSFYDAVDLVVVPTDQSTGQAIKVGEAIAHGAPLLAHAHAFSGYSPSHPLHQLRSHAEIAQACIRLSFEPEGLEELSAASVASQAAQLARVDRVVDQLVERVRRKARSAVFMVDGGRLARLPGLAAHLLSMIQLRARERRVRLLVTRPRNEDAAFYRQASKLAELLVDGEGPTPALRHGALPCSLSQLLSQSDDREELWCYDASALPALAHSGRAVTAVYGCVEGLGFTRHPAYDSGVRTFAAVGHVVRRPDGGFQLESDGAIAIRPHLKASAAALIETVAPDAARTAVVFAGRTVTAMLPAVVATLRAVALPFTVVAPDGVDAKAVNAALGLGDNDPRRIALMSLKQAGSLQAACCTHFFDLADDEVEHLALLELLRMISRDQRRGDLVWRGPPAAETPLTEVMSDLLDYVWSRNRWQRLSGQRLPPDDGGLNLLRRTLDAAAAGPAS